MDTKETLEEEIKKLETYIKSGVINGGLKDIAKVRVADLKEKLKNVH